MNADASPRTYRKNLNILVDLLKTMRVVTIGEWDDARKTNITFYSDLLVVESCEYGFLYYSAKNPRDGKPVSFQFELRTFDYKVLSKKSVVLFDREDGEIIHFSK